MIYDILILGGGPAGLTAGIYGSRAKLKTLIIEKGAIGGVITSTNEIENYPGSIPNDTGTGLTERMRQQAEGFGVEFAIDEITSVDVSSDIKILKGYQTEYKGKTVIIASGGYPRVAGCKGETEHVGMGVSYCATCDGAFFNGLEVYVVGGGNSALEEALYLTKFARKVTIIHRRDEFRGDKILQEKIFSHEKIETLMSYTIEEIKGDGPIDEILLKSTKTGEMISRKANPDEGMMGVFVFVGYLPNSALWKDIIAMDEDGYLLVDETTKTNVSGVYAAGDIRKKELRQVVTAVSDGAIAAVQTSKYLENTQK